jgi:hypothetical protein
MKPWSGTTNHTPYQDDYRILQPQPTTNEPTLDFIGSAIRTSLGSSTEGIRPSPAAALLVAFDDTTCGTRQLDRIYARGQSRHHPRRFTGNQGGRLSGLRLLPQSH